MGRGMYKRKVQNQVEENENSVFEEEIPIEEEILVEEIATPLYTVKVTHPSLRMREAPSEEAEIKGLITDQGQYNIYAEVGGWGRLDNDCWIMLQYTSKIKNS